MAHRLIPGSREAYEALFDADSPVTYEDYCAYINDLEQKLMKYRKESFIYTNVPDEVAERLKKLGLL